MSHGIDYSKWDKMNYSDDDESNTEEEDTHRVHNIPRVTRLDEPSRVTCNQDGSIEIQTGGIVSDGQNGGINKNSIDKKNNHQVNKLRSQRTEKEPVDDDKMNNDENDDSNERASHNATEPTSPSSSPLQYLTHNGGSYIHPTTKVETFWSQNRYEVILSIVFDHNIISSRDICVKVFGGLSYNDRFSAVGGTRQVTDDEKSDSMGKIQVKTKDGLVMFEGDLAYPIYFSEGEDEEVDWEIETAKTIPEKKMVKVTLLKALPMQGLTIWWNKPVIDYPEIDVVKDIDGRSRGEAVGGKTSSKQEQMKAAWDEAHRLFREKVKTRGKESIDLA